MLDQRKINFLKQAITLLKLSDVVKYYTHGTTNPMFIININDRHSLNIEWNDDKENISPLLRIFNLLGRCKANFNAFPYVDDADNFESLEISVMDLDPVWDSSKYTDNLTLKNNGDKQS